MFSFFKKKKEEPKIEEEALIQEELKPIEKTEQKPVLEEKIIEEVKPKEEKKSFFSRHFEKSFENIKDVFHKKK